ncbi:MAG: carbon-nitrogen hydrolase family protein [Pseudomonadales bacterium]|jgi:predicted amidohydrolase|nr:carbon-nitrogen hydrolase family protein [Pseudomonadales bacterium]
MTSQLPAASKQKVAVVQHCATTDVEKNLATLESLSQQAASEGADVITWPEAFAYLGRHDGKREILEALPDGGPIFHRCTQLAQRLNCELLLGGFHESSPNSDKCFNTSVYLGRDGNIKAMYRKIHLFDVNIKDGPTLQESRQTEAGELAIVVDASFGRLGLTVCYDVRFPMLYQNLADQGAIAMSVPSAFTATTGALHWHTLLKARAIETQSYVIAPAQHGQHSRHRASYGHSLIVDPWGKVVAELADGDGYVIAEVDPEQTLQVRSEIPSLANRRHFT